ncbi:MAG: SdpI family protein [Paenisporosarcina sp.]
MQYLLIGFNALISLIFILSGLFLKHKPPKKINPIYGYRTFRSMKNTDLWKKGNEFSAEIMIKHGLILIFLGTSISFLFKQPQNAIFSIMGLMIVLIIIMVIRVERKLKHLDTK